MVKVEDAGGNVVTTDSSTVTASFTGGGVSLTNPTKAAASGVATFVGSGPQRPGRPLHLDVLRRRAHHGGASNTITVSTGTATQLVITTEPSATENSGAALAQQPVVKVEDSGGNVVTSVNSGTAYRVDLGAVARSPRAAPRAPSRRAWPPSAAWRLNGVSGNVYTLTFSGDSLTSAASSNITDGHRGGHPAGLHHRALGHREQRGGSGPQPVVKVEDSGGNVVTSVNSGTASATITRALAARSPRVAPRAPSLGSGHLQRPDAQRRERQRLHPHLQR